LRVGKPSTAMVGVVLSTVLGSRTVLTPISKLVTVPKPAWRTHKSSPLTVPVNPGLPEQALRPDWWWPFDDQEGVATVLDGFEPPATRRRPIRTTSSARQPTRVASFNIVAGSFYHLLPSSSYGLGTTQDTLRRLILSFSPLFILFFKGPKPLTDDGTIAPHLYSGAVRRTTAHDAGLVTVRVRPDLTFLPPLLSGHRGRDPPSKVKQRDDELAPRAPSVPTV
jgi:hypothetical protein